ASCRTGTTIPRRACAAVRWRGWCRFCRSNRSCRAGLGRYGRSDRAGCEDVRYLKRSGMARRVKSDDDEVERLGQLGPSPCGRVDLPAFFARDLQVRDVPPVSTCAACRLAVAPDAPSTMLRMVPLPHKWG